MDTALALMTFPEIDPIALSLGPIDIRWYSLSYLAGLLAGTFLVARRARAARVPFIPDDGYDFLAWCTLGVLLGARLGLVLFYYPSMIWEAPQDILAMWKGGMSFHGGAIGVLVTTFLFTWRRKISFVAFGDEVCAVAPIGLFFGRVANFINAELWGRPAGEDVPWAMVFPGGGPLARHPSQLYEAFAEGILLFALLSLVRAKWAPKRGPGLLAGTFLVGYTAARFAMEFFRQPDDHLGFLFMGATMGQLLSIPMAVVGIWLIIRSGRLAPLDAASGRAAIEARSDEMAKRWIVKHPG